MAVDPIPPLFSNSTSPSSSTIIATDPVIPIHLPISIKLNHSNFLTWKSQILPIIQGYNLDKFITPNSSPSPTLPSTNGVATPNQDFCNWHRQDKLLLGWIRSSLTEQILSQVVSCSTTAELWSTLQQTFSSVSRARLHELRRKLQFFTKRSQTCAEYLNHIRQIADELAFIGSPVSDDDLAMVVLGGLGPDYNSFVIAATTANRTSSFSFSDLYDLLLNHEALISSQSSSSTLPSLTAPSAFYNKPSPHGSIPEPLQTNQTHIAPFLIPLGLIIK